MTEPKDSKVTFRLATRKDDDALIELKHAINLAEHAAYPTASAIPRLLDLSREAAAAGLMENWRWVESLNGAYLVGELDGEIVCCGCWYGETAAASTLPQYRQQANIGGIVVSPSVRGRGLGRAIMLELEKLILAQGIRQVRLAVVPGNGPAERLYHGLGFEDFETIMIKTLS
jgi:ribosomal protein S18 acetylase RimI-like enzyme